jgi:hypothetical protein
MWSKALTTSVQWHLCNSYYIDQTIRRVNEYLPVIFAEVGFLKISLIPKPPQRKLMSLCSFCKEISTGRFGACTEQAASK